MADRCVVWLAALPADTSRFDELDDTERQRRGRYRRLDDRNRFTIGAVLLRRAVADHLGDVEPRAITVDRTCPDCGRPHGRPQVEGIHVSVAHSGGWVAVAVTDAAPVGVDVERTHDAWKELLATACAPEEHAAVRDGHDFARVWTRKEAVLKAMGTGLRRTPSDVVVSAAADPPMLRRLGDDGTPPPCRLHDLTIDDDHAGAVAVLTDAPVEVVAADATELLAG